MATTHYYLEFEDPKMDYHLAIPDCATGRTAYRKSPIPSWARLDCRQCANCPLTVQDTEYCPPAYNMIDLVEHFSNSDGSGTLQLHRWKKVEMHTIRTNLQRALAYLYPAILAASSCPYADLLSPLKKYMKPFPEFEDFLFYALSFGLVSNYLNDVNDPTADSWSLALLTANQVALVFQGLLLRIKKASLSDANVNALIKDIQWSYMSMQPKEYFKSQLSKNFADKISAT